MSVHKKIFFLIVLLFPVNLGKHFIISSSYIHGKLLDYLVPTVYLLDVLIVMLLLAWLPFIKATCSRRKAIFKEPAVLFLGSFIVAQLCASFVSTNAFLSFYSVLRTVLYALFFIYCLVNLEFPKDFIVITRLLSVSVLLLALLGFGQWFKQRSVFDNYLVLGEQPYGSATENVAVENVFDVAKIPPYGLFRHPNVFGAFLSIVLVWLVASLKWEGSAWKFFKLGVVGLGSIVLVLTISKLAWLSFVLGILLVWLLLRRGFARFIIVLVLFGVIGGHLLPLFSLKGASIERRSDLLKASYSMVLKSPLFGIGPGLNTAYIETYSVDLGLSRYAQPVHNIFVLLTSESGILALSAFVLLLIALLRKAFRGHPVFIIALVQIILLGLFDHYFLTIHQTSLVMWLTFALTLLQFY